MPAPTTYLSPCQRHDSGLFQGRLGAIHGGPARWLLRSLLATLLGMGLTGAASWEQERMLDAAAAIGPRATVAARLLQQVIERAAPLDEAAKLAAVNNFFNQRVQFRSDVEVWGQEDYWASPLEFLDKGSGDCEDYAIGKYASLVAAGVPVPRLRLVYVRAQLAGSSQAHMVLAYYASPDAEPLILDNLVPELRAASRRPDLMPVFSFNSEGLWQGVGAQTAGNPLVRLSRWREVLAKVRAEGFL